MHFMDDTSAADFSRQWRRMSVVSIVEFRDQPAVFSFMRSRSIALTKIYTIHPLGDPSEKVY